MDMTVNIRRWWSSREMWNYIAGLALVITPIAANQVGNLGLSPVALLTWTVVINIVSYSAGMYLKTTGKTVIANKAQVEDARAVVAEPGNPENTTTVKVNA